MRNKLWKIFSAGQPEGCIFPRWLQIIRAMLFPLDYFYWRMSKAHGYQWETDIWKIEGVSYTGAAMRALANSHGETYRITRVGDCITVERVSA